MPPAIRGPRLRDGTPVRVRPLVPEDRAELAAGFARLSEQSRYSRFLGPVRELSPGWLHRLVDDVDGVRHVALVLEAAGTPIAVGRFVRAAARPDTAEVAVTVADEWQGLGAGGLLLAELAELARERGVTRFTATLHAGNEPSFRMLKRAGTVVSDVIDSPGVRAVELDLTAPR